MKRTFRGIFLAVTIVLSLLSLTGCHGSKQTSAFVVPEEFDTSRDYEISFWAKNDTNKTQIAIYKQAAEDFQTLYPNIHVTIKYYTDYSRIYNDVITNITTGTTPNVCITYPDHIATYMTGSDVIVPLDELLESEAYGLSNIEPKFLEECTLNDSVVALPFMRSTEAVYVNKTYVEALGYELPDVLTWDFMWEVSEAAMQKDADGNFLLNHQKTLIPCIYKSTDNMMITYLKQMGADYSDSQGHIGIFNDTTRDFLKTVAEHAETRAFSTFKISSYPGNFLNAGQCIFAIDSTAGASWMGCDAPNMDIARENVIPFEIAVMPVPQVDTSNPQMISQGPSICLFNKEDPQEVLASWLFARYLLSDEVQLAYAETEGYVPVTTTARQNADYQEYLQEVGIDNDLHYSVKLQATELLLNHIDDTFTTEVFNGSASLRDAAGQLIEEATRCARRHEEVDDAFLDETFENVSALYRLDQTSTTGISQNLGPLPTTSVVLLVSLAVVWCLLIAGFIVDFIHKKRYSNKA